MSRIGYALCSYNSVQSEGWFVEDGEGDFNSDAHDEIRELMDEKISFQWRKKKKKCSSWYCIVTSSLKLDKIKVFMKLK